MKARKILLIDDDDDDRSLFCEALEEVAPEIVCFTTSSCRTVIAKLNSQEIETPDLIFLDINMPIISGWQCLLGLKEFDMYRDIPVIMCSTSSHPEDIDKAQQLGALCYFTKPLDFKELRKSLAMVAEHLHNDSLSSLMVNSSLFVVPQPGHQEWPRHNI